LAGIRRDFASDNFFAALPVHDFERLITRFWELYDGQNSPYPRCLPGIRRTLKQLRGSGLAIAIATARMESRSSLVAKLTRWGIDTYVDFAVTCADSEDEPCPSKLPMLLQLLQWAGVSGRESLMVGDTPTDIECARSAGYAIQVAVCTGGIRPEILASSQPTSVVTAVSSLHCP
jgi:phosphoglycolate phosphatase-like HAD superfamily hydrolase